MSSQIPGSPDPQILGPLSLGPSYQAPEPHSLPHPYQEAPTDPGTQGPAVPAPLMCVRVVPCCPVLSVCVRPCPLPSPPPTDGFTSEGEILEISDIQRGQAGEYECVTHNGVNSAPDSRRVLVTVNCEPPGTSHEGEAGPGSLERKGLREEGLGTGLLGRRQERAGARTLSPHLARRIC